MNKFFKIFLVCLAFALSVDVGYCGRKPKFSKKKLENMLRKYKLKTKKSFWTTPSQEISQDYDGSFEYPGKDDDSMDPCIEDRIHLANKTVIFG